MVIVGSLVVCEKKTNNIKIDRKTRIKETLMESSEYVCQVKFARNVQCVSGVVDLYI